jgi:hypothetical protein
MSRRRQGWVIIPYLEMIPIFRILSDTHAAAIIASIGVSSK